MDEKRIRARHVVHFIFIPLVLLCLGLIGLGAFWGEWAGARVPDGGVGLNELAALMGVALLIVTIALYWLAIMLQKVRQSAGGGHHRPDAETISLLKSINERMLLSDTAKRIAYREKDRAALRRAILDDIAKQDFEAALAMVDEMSQVYGYREEAEEFRRQIDRAREADLERKVSRQIDHIDELVAEEKWEEARREAAAISRVFPDVPRAQNVMQHVKDKLEQFKKDLERQFLEASAREDLDTAMELLKKLDRYLTNTEAEPFREVARGVITKRRDNLGVQFKLAVQDHEWHKALTVGEEIIQDFPNTRMAEEVREMLDQLRDRAAQERSARGY
ncbi:MAG: hypothetical protein JJU36_00930 [Phycisphaeraceae bacterium]|nr:hypothetical protein [Phycisphaeraceae bacterium]